jgi:hypothetical protein
MVTRCCRAFVLLLTSFLHATPCAVAATAPAYFLKSAGHHSGDFDFALQNSSTCAEFRDREVVYKVGRRTIRVHFHATQSVHPEGLEEMAGGVTFFGGGFSGGSVPETAAGFNSLAYRELWPGIDALYSAHSGHLKTEFQIAPLADASLVRWSVEGADNITISRGGALVMEAGGDQLREDPPQVFEQERLTGELRPTDGAFRLLPDGSVGISVGAYDHSNRLIFDPVIGYSTYLGGTGESAATAVATDTSGNTIVAGYTTTLDLGGTSTVFGTAQRTSAFVAKISASGNQLLFCTYLGGTLDTRAYALAIDHWNNIYIAGETTSSDYPVYRAIQPQMKGSGDAFVAELNPAGNTLVFSTFLGGSGVDQAYGIAVNHQGGVYVTGDTSSTDFPTVKPIQHTAGGGQDAFFAKLGASGSALLSSTYLGGSGDEHAAAIAVDGSGDAVVTGSTLSSNFPVVAAWQTVTGGNQDAFVTKYNSAATAIVFSTYLGGAGGTPGLPETGAGITVDSTGAVYVAGTTSSTNFPVSKGAFQTTTSGLVNAFAVKLTASGSLVYGTYLGGSSVTYAGGIAVDSAGNAHVAGYTGCTDFPTLNAVQSSLSGGYDLFVTKLNPSGSALLYSTFWGGSLSDSAAGVAVDRYGTVLVAGITFSTNFPTQNAWQTEQHGPQSALAVRVPVGWKPTLVSQSGSQDWSVDSLLNWNPETGAGNLLTYDFGLQGDLPVVGDWNSTGTLCMGTFRQGTWYLDSNCDGVFDAGDRSFVWGEAGDRPVVGDWNGSGRVKAGLYRSGTFLLDFSGHMSGVPTGIPDVTFPFGLPTDLPVAADWDNSGTTKVGVFRNGEWILDWTGNHSNTGPVKTYGESGDLPVMGDWDGSKTTKAGVYRSGNFILDYTGSWTFNPVTDITIPFLLTAGFAFMMH